MKKKDWLRIGDDPSWLANGRRDPTLVTIDAETTGLRYPDQVLGMALAWPDGSCYLASPDTPQLSFDSLTASPVDMETTLRHILSRDNVITHNEPFDVRAVSRAIGKPCLPAVSHDLMHMAALYEYQKSRALLYLHDKYTGQSGTEFHARMKKKRSGLGSLPMGTVGEYSMEDARMTLDTFLALYPLVQHETDMGIYEQDRRYAHLVLALMNRGLKLNTSWSMQKSMEFRRRMAEISARLGAMGLRDISSNERVATFLFKTMAVSTEYVRSYTRVTSKNWPGGIPSVDSDTLDALEPLSECAALIKAFRQLQGAESEWLEGFRQHAAVDGKIHSLLDPFGTVSARMAASEPNVLAIPMEDRGAAFGSMRGLFESDVPGERLWAFDYSQAEVRLAAAEARERALLDILNVGGDPYINMAERVWGDAAYRNIAKRATLASIYEVGAEKFAATYKISVEQAVAVLRDFRRAFPRIGIASSLAAMMAGRRGYIASWSGRNRWFGPDDSTYKAFNQKIQTGIADIMKVAMLNIEDVVPHSLRLAVHDSLVISMPNSRAAFAKREKLIREAMTEAVPTRISEIVPFPVKKSKWQ